MNIDIGTFRIERFEVGFRPEPPYCRDDAGREELHAVVEECHGGVVSPPCSRELLFHLIEGCLQLEDIFVRLQLGIVLHRHVHRTQRTVHLIMNTDFLSLGEIRFHGLCTEGCDLRQHLFFMSHILLYGSHQIRDKIEPFFQISIDARKSLIGLIAAVCQPVGKANRP